MHQPLNSNRKAPQALGQLHAPAQASCRSARRLRMRTTCQSCTWRSTTMSLCSTRPQSWPTAWPGCTWTAMRASRRPTWQASAPWTPWRAASAQPGRPACPSARCPSSAAHVELRPRSPKVQQDILQCMLSAKMCICLGDVILQRIDRPIWAASVYLVVGA